MRLLETALADDAAGRARGTADSRLLGAAATRDLAAAALALRAGAEVEVRDDRGRTPLLVAVTEDHVEVARLLVHLGADPDAVDDRHDTPWLVTGVTGSVAIAEVLLSARPDLTTRNRYGGVSIIPASERGHVDYVRRVVRTSIDVNHVNDLGWTALLEAVILGDGSTRYVEIVEILLEAGADRTIADADGVTARRTARTVRSRSGADEYLTNPNSFSAAPIRVVGSVCGVGVVGRGRHVLVESLRVFRRLPSGWSIVRVLW